MSPDTRLVAGIWGLKTRSSSERWPPQAQPWTSCFPSEPSPAGLLQALWPVLPSTCLKSIPHSLYWQVLLGTSSAECTGQGVYNCALGLRGGWVSACCPSPIPLPQSGEANGRRCGVMVRGLSLLSSYEYFKSPLMSSPGYLLWVWLLRGLGNMTRKRPAVVSEDTYFFPLISNPPGLRPWKSSRNFSGQLVDRSVPGTQFRMKKFKQEPARRGYVFFPQRSRVRASWFCTLLL